MARDSRSEASKGRQLTWPVRERREKNAERLASSRIQKATGIVCYWAFEGNLS